jgi:hypothetical protein
MTRMAETPLRVEFARVNEAADLARFVRGLGLVARHERTGVAIPHAPANIERVLRSWLAEWRVPLVPAERTGHTLTLRPPSD